MKNTIRCCISCILPCGALDVIRIVHLNGRVEEITRSVRAGEIMKANPKHVLRKSTTSISDDGVVPRIVILPPDAELQRGKIYFLMPVPSAPEKPSRNTCSTRKKKKREHQSDDSSPASASANTNASAGARNRNSSKSRSNRSIANHDGDSEEGGNSISVTKLLLSDRYLSDILSEKISTQRERRRGRVGVWRPHLESIDESPADHYNGFS